MKPLWFPFYVTDWRASRRVQAMLPLARWIYFELLCEQFDSPLQSLPDVPAELAPLTGLSLEEFTQYWPSVRPCFTVRPDGRLENPRLKDECLAIADRLVKLSQHGRRAANQRWDRQLALNLAVDDARASHDDARAMHVHADSTNKQDKQDNARARARGPIGPQDYLEGCAHQPPCLTIALCSRRRQLDQALAEDRLKPAEARRLEQLWGIAKRR